MTDREEIARLIDQHPKLADKLMRYAAEAERARIRAVEAQALPGHEKLIQKLKFDGETTGDRAAALVVAAENQNRADVLETIRRESPSPAPQPSTDSQLGGTSSLDAMPLNERCRRRWDASAALRAEFVESFEAYLAYERAMENGRVQYQR